MAKKLTANQVKTMIAQALVSRDGSELMRIANDKSYSKEIRFEIVSALLPLYHAPISPPDPEEDE